MQDSRPRGWPLHGGDGRLFCLACGGSNILTVSIPHLGITYTCVPAKNAVLRRCMAGSAVASGIHCDVLFFPLGTPKISHKCA